MIDAWRLDYTYEGVYPKGARDKSAYFSPETLEEKCLKTDYRYLFKLSRSWCPWQFWGEIIAYRLGLLMGVEVPPTHIGVSTEYNPGKTTYGALIEWFYDDKKDIYVEGGQFMVGAIKDYDREKGTQHNFLDIVKIFRNFPDFAKYWAGTLALDCITGNIDRHHDNWGLILKGAKQEPISSTGLNVFSPAFDNGTALGYEILEDRIDRYLDGKRLEKYLTDPRYARHHMKWSLAELKPLNFYGLMQKFVMEFPETKGIIAKHLSFDHSQVEEIMSPLVKAVFDTTAVSKKLV